MRGIKYSLPGVAIATYVLGEVELVHSFGETRALGIWNYGYTRPRIVLNLVMGPGDVRFLAMENHGSDQATLWLARDMKEFDPPDWKQRLPKLDVTRLDSDWNPEPKIPREDLYGLPTGAQLLN